MFRDRWMKQKNEKTEDDNFEDPFEFSRLGGTGNNEAESNVDRPEDNRESKEFSVTSDTKVNEIETNVVEYLRGDPDLNSTLLTYVLKKKTPEELEGIFEMPEIKNLGEEHISEIRERIKNLETCETENYVFMLPVDKWKEQKIDIPNDSEGRFIASRNLTAVVKQPFLSENAVVYNRDDVGKEVGFFCWDKELLKAKKILLEPNGYTIPKWSSIIKKVADEIGSLPMVDDVGYRIDDDDEFSLWREKLGLDCPGERNLGGDNIWDIGEKGYFWSDETGWKNGQKYLYFIKKYIFVDEGAYLGGMASVRCVSCEKTAADNYEEDDEDNEVSGNGEENNTIEVASEKKKDTMESLKEQKSWKLTLSDFSNFIKEDLNDERRGEYSKPIWVSLSRQTVRNAQFSYNYRIEPITSEQYNSRRSRELAQPDEKRFIIERDFGYTRVMGQSGIKKNVGGFDLSWNPSIGDEKMLPEETDFTVENKAENGNIPKRINDAMYKLFSGFKYSPQEKAFVHAEEKYPNDETLKSVLEEFRSIIEDIGDVDDKIKAFEAKRSFEVEQKEKEETTEQIRKDESLRELSELAEKVKNGTKLGIDDLKIVYKEEHDNSPQAIEIRKSLGIDEGTMKSMLNIN